MFGHIVHLSPVAIFLVVSTDFGHTLVIWWNRENWLYCGHMKLRVGENGSLVGQLVICDIYMHMTTVSIAVYTDSIGAAKTTTIPMPWT